MTYPSVLLLESDPAARSHIEALLADQGFSVHAADSLAHGRALAVREPADVLVINLLLDDGNALDLAHEWVATGRPALGLSDVFFGASSRMLLLEQVGLDQVIETPFEDEELVAELRRLLPERPPAEDELDAEGGTTEETEFSFFRPAGLDAMALPLSGSLDDADMAAVLARLAMDRVSGALMLVVGTIKKLVFLDGGLPVGIKSNLLAECLGQVLVREGRITASVCEQSLEEMRRTQRQQGQVLVLMGVITPDEVERAVQRQFVAKLQQLFTWTEGYYRYRDATIPPVYHGTYRADPAQLIWEAIDATRPVARAQARLAPVLASPMEWSGAGLDLGNLPVDDELRTIYSLLDSGCTTAEALGATPDPERALLLLYALTAFGSITYLSG